VISGQLADRSPSRLVLAARSGDRGCFDELVQRYRGGVYALCLDRVRDLDVAEDLTQETVVSAWANLGQLRDPQAFPAWLRRVAVNCCLAWQRRRALGEAVQHDRPIGRVSEDAYAEAARRETAREIVDALSALPENNRLALLMAVQGHTYREIAEFLSVPDATIVGRIHRARRRLRSLLGDQLTDLLGPG